MVVNKRWLNAVLNLNGLELKLIPTLNFEVNCYLSIRLFNLVEQSKITNKLSYNNVSVQQSAVGALVHP